MATFTDPWTGERKTITRHQKPAPASTAVKPMPKGISITAEGKWGYSPPFEQRNAADWEQYVKDVVKGYGFWFR